MFATSLFILPLFLFLQYTTAESPCPSEDGNTWTPGKLFTNLTDKSVYNKNRTPKGTTVNVLARTHIYHIKASSHDYKFTIQILLQLRWKDERLNFANHNTSITQMIGEKLVMQSIWTPHIFLPNEKDSPVMGYLRKDDLITILPNGEVLFATRLKTPLACESNLRKFPFDKQTCFLPIKTWSSSEVVLDWEPEKARLQHHEITLSEFYLLNLTAEKVHDNTTLLEEEGVPNYSLLLTVSLRRQYGFYIMDFYVPSFLVVILSWLTFWLTADQVPPRVLLGSSTMLTVMLLAWFDSSFPKASQFTANKIWAFGCLAFTFLSLVEFAFVNTIDRRDKEHKVELKKPTSKYILKSSLGTPKPPTRTRQRRSSSCPSSPELRRLYTISSTSTYRTLQEASGRDLARGVRAALRDLRKAEEKFNPEVQASPKGNPVISSQVASTSSFQDEAVHVMTHQEIAMWIDERSRIVFPVGFLVFNIIYWIFVLGDFPF